MTIPSEVGVIASILCLGWVVGQGSSCQHILGMIPVFDGEQWSEHPASAIETIEESLLIVLEEG